MNHGVAVDARSNRGRASIHAMNRTGGQGAVALVAESRDAGHIQQARVLRAVRRMATDAAFSLDRGVFEDKRSAYIGVALGADGVHVGSGLQVRGQGGAVRIVAVVALDQAFFHLVMERHGELGLDFCVALEAKCRLRRLEQGILLAAVDVVTSEAADIALCMRATLEVGVFALVAAKAPLIDFLGRCIGRVEDLRFVSATIDVGLARTVASLAVHAGRPMLRSHPCVRIACEALGHFIVAGGADFPTYVVSRRGSLRLCGAGLGFRCRRSEGSGAHYAGAQHQHQ